MGSLLSSDWRLLVRVDIVTSALSVIESKYAGVLVGHRVANVPTGATLSGTVR